MSLRAYLTRCRFCGARRKRAVFVNGVCEPCKRETLNWLAEMGVFTTWPIKIKD